MTNTNKFNKAKIEEIGEEIVNKILGSRTLNILNFHYGNLNGRVSSLYFDSNIITFDEYTELSILIQFQNNLKFKQLLEETK